MINCLKNIIEFGVKSAITLKKDLIVNSNFHDDEIPKERSHYICLSVTLIDPAFTIGKNDHQVFLEEYKYIVKEKKVNRYITDDLEIFSDFDKENSDKEDSKRRLVKCWKNYSKV